MEPRFSLSRVKELGSEPTHLKNRCIGAAIGSLSGKLLYPYLSFKNAHAEYIFSIQGEDHEICLATPTHILGLANLLS